MTPRQIRVWCALVIVSLALPLAGCGGDEAEPAEPSAAALRPAYSPDGTKIAWLRTALESAEKGDETEQGTSEQTDLWIMDADGSDQKRLAASAGPGQVGPPAFSPDGKKIAYVVENTEAKTLDRHLWVMNADGTGAKALTSDPDDSDWDPSFSPDERKIVFAGIRGTENLEVCAMNADGTDPVQLTKGDTYSEDPSYSPDGKQIVFTSQRSGSREVWVMNADGTDQRPLTTLTPASAEVS
jgi:TolB protein